MNKLLDYLKIPIVKFLVKFCGLLFIWQVIYTFFLEPTRVLDSFLTKKIAQLSIYILSNWYSIYSKVDAFGLQRLFVEDRWSLRITHSCNGLILMVLFAVFLICFSGDWLLKLITSVVGVFAIYLINVFRVVSLVLVQIYAPEYLNFSHHWLFTAIVYGFVFSMWLLWINKLSKIKLVNKGSHEKA